MIAMTSQERITIAPRVSHGRACIKGRRIIVSIILDYLTAGETAEDVRRQYPTLTDDDIRAALGYAALSGQNT
jgi:uncharacterized protein (DUF433 family)